MLGCRCPCCIGIQGKSHLPGQFFQLFNVLFRDSAADTGYRLLCPILMRNDRIDIPFDDHHLLCLFDGISCHVQGIKDAILLKQKCLRRVQVLWLSITKCTSTETDYSTPRIPDGKDQSVPEVIINSTATSCFTAIPESSIAISCEATTYQLALCIPLS